MNIVQYLLTDHPFQGWFQSGCGIKVNPNGSNAHNNGSKYS